MGKTWREIASPIIYKVLTESKGLSEKEIKKLLFDAYPFGQRSLHPYKIWLDEIKKQRHKQKTKVLDNNQLNLF